MIIEKIIEKTQNIQGGEDGRVGGLPIKNKSKSAFFVDEIIQLTKINELKWVVSKEQNVGVCVKDNFVIIVSRHSERGGKYTRGTIGTYFVLIFRDGMDIMGFRDICDETAYDTDSHRFPIMDLWDFAINGEVRKPPLAHMCGRQGFGLSDNDSCPAC